MEPGTRTRNRNPEPGTRDPRSGVRRSSSLAAAFVYANSLSAPFIFDDQYAIVENPAIRSLAAARSQPHNTPLAGRPVAGLTFALNFAASELDPSAYRATNVVIHVACALLIFGLVRRTLALPLLSAAFGMRAAISRRCGAAVGGASPDDRCGDIHHTAHRVVDGAVLPAHVVREPSRPCVPAIPLSGMYWRLGACALGMGTKESMVTAPLMVVLYDRVFLFRLAARRDSARAGGCISGSPSRGVSGLSTGMDAASEFRGIRVRHQCVDLPAEPVRHDPAIFATGVLAARSRHQLRPARRVFPSRRASAGAASFPCYWPPWRPSDGIPRLHFLARGSSSRSRPPPASFRSSLKWLQSAGCTCRSCRLSPAS